MTLLEIVLLSLGLSSAAYIALGLFIEFYKDKREDRARKIYEQELERLRKTKA